MISGGAISLRSGFRRVVRHLEDDVSVTSAPDWKARPEKAEYSAMRRRLVDAAERIVRTQGAAALRLDSVGDAVGLHRSSVYRYFDSKEELLTAVAMKATFRVGREVIDALGESAAPERLLVEGLAMAMAKIAVDPVHRSLMAPSASEAMTRVGSRALTEGIRPLVEPMFVAAADRGLLRPGVTIEDASRWLLIVATGLFRVPDVVADVDELTDLLELMLVPALLDTSRVQPRRRVR
jgi:AcrR family transcriptional regulator